MKTVDQASNLEVGPNEFLEGFRNHLPRLGQEPGARQLIVCDLLNARDHEDLTISDQRICVAEVRDGLTAIDAIELGRANDSTESLVVFLAVSE